MARRRCSDSNLIGSVLLRPSSSLLRSASECFGYSLSGPLSCWTNAAKLWRNQPHGLLVVDNNLQLFIFLSRSLSSASPFHLSLKTLHATFLSNILSETPDWNSIEAELSVSFGQWKRCAMFFFMFQRDKCDDELINSSREWIFSIILLARSSLSLVTCWCGEENREENVVWKPFSLIFFSFAFSCSIEFLAHGKCVACQSTDHRRTIYLFFTYFLSKLIFFRFITNLILLSIERVYSKHTALLILILLFLVK